MKKITLFMSFICALYLTGFSQALNEGFEGVFPPTNWTLDTVSGAATWVSNTGNNNGSVPNAHTGTLNAMFYSANYNGDITKLITPSMDLSVLPAYDLSFWYTQNDWGGDQDTLTIYYKNSAVGPWVYLASYNTSITSWTQVSLSLPNLSNDYYIAFEGFSGYGYGVTLDDVLVDAPPSCPDPSLLTVTAITSTSANLGWTDASGSLWHIEWDTTGFVQGTGNTVAGTVNNPHNLTGLTPNTTYDFYVISDCGADSSNWVGPYTFSTACNVFTVPFIETFSSVSPTQNCWTIINNNNDAYFWDMDYTNNSLAGDEVAVMYTDGNSGADDDFMASPTITLTGNEQLRFSYRVESSNEPNDFEVLLSTTGVGATNFTNTLLPLTSANNITYQEQVINLSAFTGNVNIAFRVPPGITDGWRLYIDSVVIEQLPPDDIGVISIESTQAGCGLGMETVSVKVFNYGSNAQSNFDVAYSLNSGSAITETVVGTVNSGDTLTHVFTALANMSTPGMYNIDAWSELTGDVNNMNDSLNGWMTEHIVNTLAFVGQDSIHDGFVTGSQTSICTNGLVSGNLGSCTELSALVIDSLAHTYVGDLEIWLISPSGDSLLVSYENGGGNANIIDVTFTDTASTNISGNTPTPSSFFHTEDTLGFSVFDGTNPEGQWKLWIMDNAGGDNGSIYNWHLEFVDNSFSVDLGADTTTCDSISITLDAGISGSHSYMWSTGEATQQITVDTTTLGGSGVHNVYVTVTDSLTGCMITDSIMVTYTSCVGINSFSTNFNMNIVPNPNTGNFLLNINIQDINQLSVQVINVQGQTVFAKNNFDNVNKVNEQIDLSNNSKGIYFVVITTDKGIKTEKLIIQ